MFSDVVSKLTTEISKEDQAYIDNAKDDVEKEFRNLLVTHALHLNGAFDLASPGVGVAYIDRECYFQLVAPIDSLLLTETEAANLKAIPTTVRDLVEKARNWAALGKGKGGFAGACVRFALRGYVDHHRETTLIKTITKEDFALAKEFAQYSNDHSILGGVWYKNAWNVLGLSCSNFIRESHHWNSQNTKPIKALLGSLSQENEITEPEYRKLFYLSIHPIPLEVFAKVYLKRDDQKDADLSETVKTRLNVAPAGFADFCACAIAAEAFLREDFADRATISTDIKKLVHHANHIKKNPIAYHPFASQMGYEQIRFEKGAYNEAMIILAAYIKACIGGTLSNSPALIKFIESNLRRVNVLAKSFKEYNDRKSEDLMKILLGAEEVDIDNIVDKIKPVAKAAAKLKGMSDRDDDPMAHAAKMLEQRIVQLVEAMDRKAGKPQDLDNIELPELPVPKLKGNAIPHDKKEDS